MAKNMITKDPVDEATSAKQERDELAKVEKVGFDLSKFSMGDVKGVKPGTVRAVHPFEGYTYPMGKDAAFIVHFSDPVSHDLSGDSYTVNKPYKMGEKLVMGPYEGKTLEFVQSVDPGYVRELLKQGKEQRAPLFTFHNRIIYDYEAGQNVDVVFDRSYEMSDGVLEKCAFVPQHSIRAQLLFRIDDRTGAVKSDPRYKLIDTKQARRLYRIVQMLAKPRQLG